MRTQVAAIGPSLLTEIGDGESQSLIEPIGVITAAIDVQSIIFTLASEAFADDDNRFVSTG